MKYIICVHCEKSYVTVDVERSICTHCGEPYSRAYNPVDDVDAEWNLRNSAQFLDLPGGASSLTLQQKTRSAMFDFQSGHRMYLPHRILD